MNEEFDRFEEHMANEIMVTVADKLKDESHLPVSEQSLVFRLRKRAEIRRQIKDRKSVQEGANDRIADLLEEAAGEIEKLEQKMVQLETEITEIVKKIPNIMWKGVPKGKDSSENPEIKKKHHHKISTPPRELFSSLCMSPPEAVHLT